MKQLPENIHSSMGLPLFTLKTNLSKIFFLENIIAPGYKASRSNVSISLEESEVGGISGYWRDIHNNRR